MAWFFILLLAGQEIAEAARMQRRVRPHPEHRHKPKALSILKHAGPDAADKQVEADWKAENRRCGSKRVEANQVCNAGPKNHYDKSVHLCAGKALASDAAQPDPGCQVSDDWMLKGTPDKPTNYWLTMHINLLKAKTSNLPKVKNSCGEGMWRCSQHMQHILRSVRFIAKAAQVDGLASLTPKQRDTAQNSAEAAIEQITRSMLSSTSQQRLVKRLLQVLKKDEYALKHNAKATIVHKLKVLHDILRPNANLNIVEEEINKMEEQAKPAETVDVEAAAAFVNDLRNVSRVSLQLRCNGYSFCKYGAQTIDEHIAKLENAIIDPGTNTNTSDDPQVFEMLTVIVLPFLFVPYSLSMLDGFSTIFVPYITVYTTASILKCAVASVQKGKYYACMGQELEDALGTGLVV